jgi:hypothetical protein
MPASRAISTMRVRRYAGETSRPGCRGMHRANCPGRHGMASTQWGPRAPFYAASGGRTHVGGAGWTPGGAPGLPPAQTAASSDPRCAGEERHQDCERDHGAEHGERRQRPEQLAEGDARGDGGMAAGIMKSRPPIPGGSHGSCQVHRDLCRHKTRTWARDVAELQASRAAVFRLRLPHNVADTRRVPNPDGCGSSKRQAARLS